MRVPGIRQETPELYRRRPRDPARSATTGSADLAGNESGTTVDGPLLLWRPIFPCPHQGSSEHVNWRRSWFALLAVALRPRGAMAVPVSPSKLAVSELCNNWPRCSRG
ncbi:hypothetical protein RugamoR1_54890 [Rugamonas sp. R1(2021)]